MPKQSVTSNNGQPETRINSILFDASASFLEFVYHTTRDKETKEQVVRILFLRVTEV